VIEAARLGVVLQPKRWPTSNRYGRPD
jgi:hypothetical protein